MNNFNLKPCNYNYYQEKRQIQNQVFNRSSNCRPLNGSVSFKSNPVKSFNKIISNDNIQKVATEVLACFAGISGVLNINNQQIKQTRLVKEVPFAISEKDIENVTLRLGEFKNNDGVDLPLNAFLMIIKGLKIGDTIKVGRDQNSDICLPEWTKDLGVSREHIEITKTSNGIMIRDTSKYGTIINSKRKACYSINEDDIIFLAKPLEVYNCSSDSNLDIVSNRNIENKRLDKYVANSSKRIKVTSKDVDNHIAEIANLIEDFNISSDMSKGYIQTLKDNREHIKFILSRPDLFKNPKPFLERFATWKEFSGLDSDKHIAWKMHVFSDKSEDWQNLSEVIIPYLIDHGINFKTFNIGRTPEGLSLKQKGKAFTIYPTSNEQMAQVARDLDYIIRRNNLNHPNSNIVGDAKLGNSGRLFYRYEYRSKYFKDEVVNVSENYNYYRYQLYEKNRGNIPNAHLAKDMTPEDDIWKDFEPSRIV